MTLRDYLELGYFGAGIVLAVAALIGLYQISLSKKDIADRERRASLEKAMEYAGKYESIVIPLLGKFHDKCSLFRKFVY